VGEQDDSCLNKLGIGVRRLTNISNNILDNVATLSLDLARMYDIALRAFRSRQEETIHISAAPWLCSTTNTTDTISRLYAVANHHYLRLHRCILFSYTGAQATQDCEHRQDILLRSP
jgi:hypothetical protein